MAGTPQHQGILAIAAAKQSLGLDDLLKRTAKKPDHSGLLVLVDGVEDPHNLGAIIRTALAAGTDGVILPERRAAGLGDTVARASAGALEHLPVARVVNMSQAMEELKECGYWLVGLDEHAEKVLTDIDLTGSIGLVLGGEGGGLHGLVRKRCDFLAAIPTVGPVRSLNVSVAAGIVLFEAVRQRRAKSGTKFVPKPKTESVPATITGSRASAK
jgi:23S rRNA (guanosine2251-2'-O)-methyltransferase